MNPQFRLASAILAAAVAAAAPASAATIDHGAAARGATLFRQKCGVCHGTEPGQSRVGPTMFGVVGRKAGTEPHFHGYSPAMKASNVTWTAETLDEYLAKPKGEVPGNRMPFPGVPSAQDRAAIIAYLETLK